MKLSLAELKVDSYASQVSETELTAVKGGSSAPCIGWLYAAGAAIVTAAATVTAANITASTDHKECGNRRIYHYNECGDIICIEDKHVCNE